MSRGSRVRSPPGVFSACSVMVIIDASQALDPGSIPGRRIRAFYNQNDFLFMLLVSRICIMYAHVAQLGERQTEDLKVLGSIPSVGKLLFW